MKPNFISATTWKGEYYNYVQEKKDGHRVWIENNCAWTRLGHNIMPQLLKCKVYFPPNLVMDGEIYLPNHPASLIKTALAAQIPAIKFAAFALPKLNIPFEQASYICRSAGVDFLPWRVRHDKDTKEFLLHEAKERGYEGFILKKSHLEGWYKLKLEETLDLKVTGIKPGNGKYLGMCGALLCDHNGVEIAVSGMTDEERKNISEKDIGRIVEIKYQHITKAGSLRHPRFVRWRDDKA